MDETSSESSTPAAPLPDNKQVLMEAYFSGPLPMPQLLEGYEQAVPGAGEKIIEWTETSLEHRRSIELKESLASIQSAKRGQWMAFALAAAGIIVGGSVSIWGEGWAASLFGAILGAGGLTPIVLGFLERRKETMAARPYRHSAQRDRRLVVMIAG